MSRVRCVGRVGRIPYATYATYVTHDPQPWQARRVSNPQPPVLETGALPIELLAFAWSRGPSPRSAPLAAQDYFVSLCPVCFLQYLQYLLSSRRSDDFFRFFVVL